MTRIVSSGADRNKKSKPMAWWALYVACGILAIVCLLVADASRKPSAPASGLPAVSAPGLPPPVQQPDRVR